MEKNTTYSNLARLNWVGSLFKNLTDEILNIVAYYNNDISVAWEKFQELWLQYALELFMFEISRLEVRIMEISPVFKQVWWLIDFFR